MKTHSLGYLLLKTRKEKHLTQQELADTLHISPTTISKWERGNSHPDLEKLKLLSSVLEIPLPLLLGIDYAETNESAEKTVTTEKTSTEEVNVAFKPKTINNKISPHKEFPNKKVSGKSNLTIALFSINAMFLLFFSISFFLRSRNT